MKNSISDIKMTRSTCEWIKTLDTDMDVYSLHDTALYIHDIAKVKLL